MPTSSPTTGPSGNCDPIIDQNWAYQQNFQSPICQHHFTSMLKARVANIRNGKFLKKNNLPLKVILEIMYYCVRTRFMQSFRNRATERKFSYRAIFRDEGSDTEVAQDTVSDITAIITRSSMLSNLVKGLRCLVSNVVQRR